jgi:hypothetical protein
MNKKPLLLALKISLVPLFVGLSSCAAPVPEETWKPVAMSTTTPIHTARKIYFAFDVSVENRDKTLNQSLPYDSSSVKNWTAFASQMVKELKVAGVDADFIISTDKIAPEADKLRNIRVPSDVTHVVSLVESRTLSRGQVIVDAWWVATVYQVNAGKKWDEKSEFDKISLYKYKYVGWDCIDSLRAKDDDADCVKKHTSFHFDNLKKIGIL